MSKQIYFNNLIYHFTTPGLVPINFVRFKNPAHIYNDIKNGNAALEKIEENQKQFKSSLSETTTRNTKYRKEDQLNKRKSIKNLYKSKEKVIKLFNDYVKIRSEAMCKTKIGIALKILTPKQMFQTLLIALALALAVLFGKFIK